MHQSSAPRASRTPHAYQSHSMAWPARVRDPSGVPKHSMAWLGTAWRVRKAFHEGACRSARRKASPGTGFAARNSTRDALISTSSTSGITPRRPGRTEPTPRRGSPVQDTSRVPKLSHSTAWLPPAQDASGAIEPLHSVATDDLAGAGGRSREACAGACCERRALALVVQRGAAHGTPRVQRAALHDGRRSGEGLTPTSGTPGRGRRRPRRRRPRDASHR